MVLSSKRVVNGAVAGFLATAPMSGLMLLGQQFLPRRERHPLPPRKITMEAAEKAGVENEMAETERNTATAAAHFAYGAAVGALYGAVGSKLGLSPAISGTAFGLAVWTGSYLGLMPALGLYPPATKDTAGRNALMIAAHVVWGSATGIMLDQLSQKS